MYRLPDNWLLLTSLAVHNKMAVSLYNIAEYFKGELKLLKRGEDSVKSQHVERFEYDGTSGIMCGKVHASMKNKVYDVQVSNTLTGIVGCQPWWPSQTGLLCYWCLY